MNATKKLAISLIILIAASAFTFNALYDEKRPSGNSQNETLVFYYGSTCPHCKVVEDDLAHNDPSTTLQITQKEAWSDQANANDYINKAKTCMIYEGQITVPMLWDANSQKCFVGDQPIIDFIKPLLGK
ncbi:MAG: hypothetical protein MUD10_01050 [Candidatus Pacebacteria bacterium]|nr:hypothetical protein [Candidatus Paceibacterota bacterium]